jgi:hypothetical protein
VEAVFHCICKVSFRNIFFNNFYILILKNIFNRKNIFKKYY